MKNKEKEKTNAAVEYAKQFDLGLEYNIAFDGFIEGTNWSDEHPREGLVDIDKVCDAYCKVCGHYAHSVPTHICRYDCDYYSRFRKFLKE